MESWGVDKPKRPWYSYLMMTNANAPVALTIPGINLKPASFFRATDVAKILRKLLAISFPAVTFSVKSQYYSMGSSVNIRWTDGPTERQVNAVISPLYQRRFDGMTDSTYYDAPCTVNGIAVSTSCFINASRQCSDAMIKVAENQNPDDAYEVLYRLEQVDGHYRLHPHNWSDEEPVVVG